jgi:hypothetical protein
LPVSEIPAEFQPTLIQGAPPIWKITGSPVTVFSIATIPDSASGPRSLLWPTMR